MSIEVKAALPALLAGLLVSAAPVYAQVTQVADNSSTTGAGLESVIVTGEALSAPRLTTIPGATTVIQTSDVKLGRVANIADALKYVPGLIAQSQSGGESTRFSLRGSSLIRGAGSWGTGLQQLFDGLPMTSPAGSPYEYFDALPLSSIQVLAGANAFEYSPIALGGAINYIPHTGYDASPFLFRGEVGSFNYTRAQVSSGQVIGNFDYYVNVDRFSLGGYRDRNTTYSNRLTGDFGYSITPQLKTRFYAILAQQDTQNVSAVTQAQIQSNPTLNTTTAGKRHDPGSVFLANKTDYAIDDISNVSFGIVYKDYPLQSPQGGSNPGQWTTSDLALSLRYVRQDKIFGGLNSKTTVAVLNTLLLPGAANRGYTASYALAQKDFFSGRDTSVIVSNDLEPIENLWLTTGGALIWQQRGSNIIQPVQDNLQENFFNFAPRVGLRYDVTPEVQLYTNFSRSVEAPIPLYLPQSVSNLYRSNLAVRPQTANSFEIGAQGGNDRFNWSLTAYQSWLNHELLTVQITPATPTTPAVTQTTNATPTIHRGIEQALQATLWKFGETGGVLKAREAVTLNDFYFENDPVWKHNALPSLPKQFVQVGLDYTNPAGFYVGFDAESVTGKYPTDFSNSLFVKPYTIFGAKIGLTPPFFGLDNNWQVFLAVSNLTDKHYASASSATFDAHGLDAAVFTPGVGRDYSFGVTYQF